VRRPHQHRLKSPRTTHQPPLSPHSAHTRTHHTHACAHAHTPTHTPTAHKI
jgi:hypothetical protein